MNVIFTFVYASKVDDETVASFCEVVERHGGNVQFVQLTCDSERWNSECSSRAARRWAS